MENNLIPFDLEKALAGEPVQTRDGRPVKIAGYNPDACEGSKIIGWVDNSDRQWCGNGRYVANLEHVCDLFMAPKPKIKKGGWVNVYNSKDGRLTVGHVSAVFKTESWANNAALPDRLACIYIEWEEEA